VGKESQIRGQEKEEGLLQEHEDIKERIVQILKANSLLPWAAAIGFIAMLCLSISMVVGFLFFESKIGSARIDVADISNTAELLDKCKSIEPHPCSINEASLTEINQQLNSINGALKLEETTALIGIFVSVSTILIPLFVIYNLNNERQEIKDDSIKTRQEMKDDLNNIKQEIENETNKTSELVDDIKEKDELLRQSVMDAKLSTTSIQVKISSIKTAYFKDIKREEYTDGLMAYHDLEEILYSLLKDERSVINSFKRLVNFANNERIRGQVEEYTKLLNDFYYKDNKSKQNAYSRFIGTLKKKPPSASRQKKGVPAR
jgi:uncharacterized protein YoxC